MIPMQLAAVFEAALIFGPGVEQEFKTFTL